MAPLSITIRPGTSRVITQHFQIAPIVSGVGISNTPTNSDIKVEVNCFEVGDTLGICQSSAGCHIKHVTGTCPTIAAIAGPTLTIAGVSVPVGAAVSLYRIPKLRGLWLSLIFTPNRLGAALTGFVRSALGSTHYLIEGYEDLAPGSKVSGLPFFQGTATVVSVRHLEGDTNKCYTSVVLDRPALVTVNCSECYPLTIAGEVPIVVNGAQSATSKGQGACGALQVTINRNHSDALSRWGKGNVGRWDLVLNNGWSQNSPVSSEVLQSGFLVVT